VDKNGREERAKQIQKKTVRGNLLLQKRSRGNGKAVNGSKRVKGALGRFIGKGLDGKCQTKLPWGGVAYHKGGRKLGGEYSIRGGNEYQVESGGPVGGKNDRHFVREIAQRAAESTGIRKCQVKKK